MRAKQDQLIDKNSPSFDPDRLAGREYEVCLEYTVEFRTTVTAGPEEHQAIEEAMEIAYPGGPTDPSDWDLVFEYAEVLRDIWMDDPEASNIVSWLREPHVPSENTYWDDSIHFDNED